MQCCRKISFYFCNIALTFAGWTHKWKILCKTLHKILHHVSIHAFSYLKVATLTVVVLKRLKTKTAKFESSLSCRTLWNICMGSQTPQYRPWYFTFLTQDIQALESSQQRTEKLRKKFIGSLILYSILLYIVAALICYFYDFPKSWKAKAVRSIPLLVFPFV